jgi:hypothetical protein
VRPMLFPFVVTITSPGLDIFDATVVERCRRNLSTSHSPDCTSNTLLRAGAKYWDLRCIVLLATVSAPS